MQTPILFTLTAHRQARWTPGWITTNLIVFPRVGGASFPALSHRGGGQSPQGLVGPFCRHTSAATFSIRGLCDGVTL